MKTRNAEHGWLFHFFWMFSGVVEGPEDQVVSVVYHYLVIHGHMQSYHYEKILQQFAGSTFLYC